MRDAKEYLSAKTKLIRKKRFFSKRIECIKAKNGRKGGIHPLIHQVTDMLEGLGHIDRLRPLTTTNISKYYEKNDVLTIIVITSVLANVHLSLHLTPMITPE